MPTSALNLLHADGEACSADSTYMQWLLPASCFRLCSSNSHNPAETLTVIAS